MSEQFSTKDRILEVAFQLFTEGSYHTISLNDIAEVVGTTRGNILHHFNSKIELARNCLEIGMMQMMPSPREPLSPRETLETMIDQMIVVATERPNWVRFFLDVMEEEAKLEPTISQTNKPFWFKLTEDMFMQLVELLRQEGVPNPMNRAIVLLSCLDGLAIASASMLLPIEALLGLRHESKQDLFDAVKRELLALIFHDAKHPSNETDNAKNS